MKIKAIPNDEKMPQTVWALGFVSLLMDTSSEIVHGLLPVFLVSVMGASFSMVGIIEGFGEAATLILKVFSGPLSDHFGKRKPFVVLGYSMGALSKPLFALASTPSLIFCARLFDRSGKGIRGAPRDALIADVTPSSIRGKAFGLRQALDTIGAFIGPLIAIGLMFLLHDNYRLIFWLATIPGILSVIVLVFGVKEPATPSLQNAKRISWSVIQNFKASFWMIAVAGAFFQFARFSEAFLILRAKDLGLATALAPLVLVIMNLVYSATAYPIGKLSDKMNREWMLFIGAIFLAASDAFLGLGNSLVQIFIGILFWGLHMGFTQGVLAALIADASPQEYRGTAFGLFNLFSAMALLGASLTAGLLWDHHGAPTTFLVSGILALLGAVLLIAGKKFWSQVVE